MAKKDEEKTVLLENKTERTFYVSEGRALAPKGADFFSEEEAEKLTDLYPDEIVEPTPAKKAPASSTKPEKPLTAAQLAKAEADKKAAEDEAAKAAADAADKK